MYIYIYARELVYGPEAARAQSARAYGAVSGFFFGTGNDARVYRLSVYTYGLVAPFTRDMSPKVRLISLPRAPKGYIGS